MGLSFLEKLCHQGFSLGFFETKKISEIEPNCNQSLEVIDFDLTKAKVCSHCRLVSLKSCDALKVIKKENRLDFIELKKFEKLLSYIKSLEDCEKSVRDFEIPIKVKDSIVILRNLTQIQGFNLTKAERQEYFSLPINFILAVDLDFNNDPLNSFAVSLKALSIFPNSGSVSLIESLTNIIKEELEKQLAEIRNINNIHHVELIKFNQIDIHYGLAL
ncbi:hypothetical protein MSKOL_1651 [Methanosarcina sp. Kolksee]|uniref:hypothetical protein n=1 Tax=Methanosarcina sp. Kolksee TaxID=1434099 RepID=UPI0006160CE4|nr:hypothetical protein [Methanosarcina sp. Kolksee]AKB47428.1 hypothetical protein MSKOL_1651 [Methanosarcina sp. Kolksee]